MLRGRATARQGRACIPRPLERSGFDDAIEQGRKPALLLVEPLDDPVYGIHVIVFQSAAQRVGQQFFTETAVKIEPMTRDQSLFHVPNAIECLTGNELARCIDENSALFLTSHDQRDANL